MKLIESSIVASALALAAPTDAAGVDFVREVRPIFQKHCYACHGAEKQKSGLRLDIKSEAFKGGVEHAPDIIAGKATESPLIRFVSGGSEGLIMPPKGERLSSDEVAVLTAWIDEGAVWPDGVDLAKLEDKMDHWSFKPVQQHLPPETKNKAWPFNGVDSFILARLEKADLQPAPETDRVAWLRRVSLDLTGLPPAPEQVAAFVKDARGDAYERVVDELLQSPRYGERWAQHWLDVVRYADTHGFEVNTERPHAWPYRDYVIRAFNADTPYDRFIREQIVGDALGEDAATGFLVTASVLLPGQIGKDEPSKRLARQDSLDEIVTNVGQTFLGLSVGCARCHDHMFDPVSQRDYYAMQSFFAGVEYADRELRTPEAESLRKETKELNTRVAGIDRQLAGLLPPTQVKAGAGKQTDSGVNELAVSSVAAKLQPTLALSTNQSSKVDETEVTRLMQEKRLLQEKIKVAAIGQKAFAGTFRTPDSIHLLHRGNPERPREEIAPAVLSALGTIALPQDAPEQQRRLVLAEWIASPRNPLTSRVMVNRIWQGHFGTGLVGTPSDFGRNGTLPSHPKLLDWLALEFIRSGWSVKHMHRLIVLSSTYRQSSRLEDVLRAKDADDRLLGRYPSRRLEAEIIRDAVLALSGRLNLMTGGRGFDLFDKRGGLSGFKPVESFRGEGLRRMIYAHKVRRESDAVFGAFDRPDAGQGMAHRQVSTTPIQALNLFNSRFTLEACDAFAARLRSEAGEDVTQQIRRAWLLALSREPGPAELADVESVVRTHGLATVCRALFNSNEFLFLP